MAGILATGALARADSLQNGLVRADFDARGLTNLTDLATGKSLPFEHDGFSLSVGGDRFVSSAQTPVLERQNASRRIYLFTDGQWTFKAIYALEPGWRFLSKRIAVSTTATTNFLVNRVEVMRGSLATPIASRQPVNSGCLLRFNDGAGTPISHGLFLDLQMAPQYAEVSATQKGLLAAYSPGLVWNMNYGVFNSDRLLIGPYTLSGVTYPVNQVPEWQYIPGTAPSKGPTMDRSELDALSDCVRAFLLWRPARATRVHVGWCENDYQIDVGTPAGHTEYQRILDQAAAVGCHDVLYTPANSLLSSVSADSDSWGWENVLWMGLGQQIRTNAWYPGRDPLPPLVQGMLDYARRHGLKLMAYAYPSLPFKQNPRWTARSGQADSGQRSFQDWWLKLLLDFQKATGIDGWSFDYWLLGNPRALSTPYAQWYGCRRILETLRRRLPKAVIDGRQQYQYYGAWTWLAGSYPHPLTGDEQPVSFHAFPDLHWDRVSADRQRWAAWWYRVKNFAPPQIIAGYMTHQTPRENASGAMPRTAFRRRDWDYLGWRYSVISAIGTGPFNLVVNYLPARDTNEFKAFSTADKQWLRGWFNWVDENLNALRNLHPILNQPQLGRLDGTAAFKNGHGFVFLFNPNYRPLQANFTLNRSIGLTHGGPFVLRQLYPDAEKGKLFAPPSGAFWRLGDSVSLPMPGADALVLEVAKAPRLTQPLLLGARGAAAIHNGVLSLTNVTGQMGRRTSLRVALPEALAIRALSVNGAPNAFQRHGNTVDATVRFAGAPFDRLQQIGHYDPAFTGGVYQAQITIPSRVFHQLKARKAAWPIPYTADDLRATWLGSYRLLLFVNVANPNPGMAVSLRIDGQRVALTPAYMTIYNIGANNSFVGWYADLSSAAPDVPHQFRLTLPRLAPGQFQGLFLDNVEAAYTNGLRR